MVRVVIQAAGVSFVDSLLCEGRYQVKPDLPYIPGTEFCGVVDAIGPGVEDLQVGDRVCASGTGGAMTESLITAAEDLCRIPDGYSHAEAACFRVNYLTVFHGLTQRACLEAGETVLVLGAAGGIGLAAVQMAKALGARVIALAGSPERRALALSCGAEQVLDSRSEHWRGQVRDLAPKGIDVVVDPVGGPASETAFRCLGWGGRHLVIGFASGNIPHLPTNLALLKGSSLVGVDVLQLSRKEPDRAQQNWRDLVDLASKCDLKPRIGRRYSLDQFATAIPMAASGTVAGRVVIDMLADPQGSI
jgi:NADPH2:quinone reductase